MQFHSFSGLCFMGASDGRSTRLPCVAGRRLSWLSGLGSRCPEYPGGSASFFCFILSSLMLPRRCNQSGSRVPGTGLRPSCRYGVPNLPPVRVGCRSRPAGVVVVVVAAAVNVCEKGSASGSASISTSGSAHARCLAQPQAGLWLPVRHSWTCACFSSCAQAELARPPSPAAPAPIPSRTSDPAAQADH